MIGAVVDVVAETDYKAYGGWADNQQKNDALGYARQ